MALVRRKFFVVAFGIMLLCSTVLIISFISCNKKQPEMMFSLETFLNPYDAESRSISTNIHVSQSGSINDFSILSYDAKDQLGNDCPLTYVHVGYIKGGVSIGIGTQVDNARADRVVIKIKIEFNGRQIDVVREYKKRTQAQRNALNPKDEWACVKEADIVKVLGRPDESATRPSNTGK